MSLEQELLDRFIRHRDSLKLQIRMMRSGKLRTLEGPTDTTPDSLHIAQESLATVECLIERYLPHA